VRAGAQRLIVKTTVEARQIPTVAENVAALETSAHTARTLGPGGPGGPGAPDDGDRDTPVYAEARALVEAVLCLGPDIGRGLLTAFGRGWLDVPYCLHPDNAGRSAGFIDERGRLGWSSVGAMPLGHVVTARPAAALTSSGLLDALHYVETRLDLGELTTTGPHREPAPARS
jgi:methylaspartate mutase epsilon subunit